MYESQIPQLKEAVEQHIETAHGQVTAEDIEALLVQTSAAIAQAFDTAGIGPEVLQHDTEYTLWCNIYPQSNASNPRWAGIDPKPADRGGKPAEFEVTFKVTFQGHPQDEPHTAAARPMAPPTIIPIVLPTEQGYHPHHISPLQTRRTPAQVKGVIKQQIFKTSKKFPHYCSKVNPEFLPNGMPKFGVLFFCDNTFPCVLASLQNRAKKESAVQIINKHLARTGIRLNYLRNPMGYADSQMREWTQVRDAASNAGVVYEQLLFLSQGSGLISNVLAANWIMQFLKDMADTWAQGHLPHCFHDLLFAWSALHPPPANIAELLPDRLGGKIRTPFRHNGSHVATPDLVRARNSTTTRSNGNVPPPRMFVVVAPPGRHPSEPAPLILPQDELVPQVRSINFGDQSTPSSNFVEEASGPRDVEQQPQGETEPKTEGEETHLVMGTEDGQQELGVKTSTEHGQEIDESSNANTALGLFWKVWGGIWG